LSRWWLAKMRRKYKHSTHGNTNLWSI
jgi:hypothetical protein